MLIVSICGIIGLLIGKKVGSCGGWFEAILLGTIFAGLSLGISEMFTPLLTPLMANIAPVETEVIEKKIYALNDTSSNQGTHYLYSGYINNELKYRYVVGTSNGKQVKETKTTNVFIKEENCEPKVKIYKRVLKYKSFSWLFFVELPDEDKVEFYVSENTVTNDYKIDLK